MGQPYFLLTTRKRAIVALVHSLAFLMLAIVLRPVPSLALTLVYGVVTAVLVTLAVLSRGAKERLYFVLCATSAAFGFARMTISHPLMSAAPHVRIITLAAAVVVCLAILRTHSQS